MIPEIALSSLFDMPQGHHCGVAGINRVVVTAYTIRFDKVTEKEAIRGPAVDLVFPVAVGACLLATRYTRVGMEKSYRARQTLLIFQLTCVVPRTRMLFGIMLMRISLSLSFRHCEHDRTMWHGTCSQSKLSTLFLFCRLREKWLRAPPSKNYRRVFPSLPRHKWSSQFVATRGYLIYVRKFGSHTRCLTISQFPDRFASCFIVSWVRKTPWIN